jgi:hypothetical protein
MLVEDSQVKRSKPCSNARKLGCAAADASQLLFDLLLITVMLNA